MNARHAVPFRWVLPVAELILCISLLWPLKGLLFFQLQSSAHAQWPTRVQEPEFRLDPAPILDLKLEPDSKTLGGTRTSIPALLNLPGAFLGLARTASAPKGMLPEFWRAISWPVVGIVFWWIAGRSIEALAASRRRLLAPIIVWLEVLVASLVIAFSSALCVGFILDPSIREEFIYPWRLTAVAAGLWILLGAATISARVVQWRIRRQLRIEAKPG